MTVGEKGQIVFTRFSPGNVLADEKLLRSISWQGLANQ
jgi:hypothetical protein